MTTIEDHPVLSNGAFLLRDTLGSHIASFRSSAWTTFRGMYPQIPDVGLFPIGQNGAVSIKGQATVSERSSPRADQRRTKRILDKFEVAGFNSLDGDKAKLTYFAASSFRRSKRRKADELPQDLLSDFDVTPLAFTLAAHAYSDAGFRWAVAMFARRVLERRIVFYPDEPPRVSLSTPTFLWLLDADRLLPRIINPKQRLRDSQSTLSLIGRELECFEGWAGFWDQYFLMEAKKHKGRASSVVDDLPLLKSGLDAFSLDPATDPPTVKPSWRQEVPRYATRLIEGLP